MIANQPGLPSTPGNVLFDPADWLLRFEALGHVAYLWIGMNGDGLSLFRTLSGGDGHRALVHELRGDPATAEARERALVEQMKATCRYGHPTWRVERLEEGWTTADFEAFLDHERRRWRGHEARRRKG
jgi:hypothetical protein